jgi:hypothetical protein
MQYYAPIFLFDIAFSLFSNENRRLNLAGLIGHSLKLTIYFYIVCVEFYLHSSYYFIVQCLIKHRDRFSYTLPIICNEVAVVDRRGSA